MTDHVVPPFAILMAINKAAAGGKRGSVETFDRQIAFAFSLNPTDAELVAAEHEARDSHDPNIKNIQKVIRRARDVVEHASQMPGGRWVPPAGRAFE